MKHTSKVTLEYYRESRLFSLKSYVDSNWASSEECKSTSGMVHLHNNSVIAWSSKKQAIIALSTGEAEYPQHTLTRIHEDNQTCISFTRDDTMHSHTKHINVKYHFTRFQIDEGVITLIDTRIEDQLVDLFTKQQTVK
jgi:hypothetical protein